MRNLSTANEIISFLSIVINKVIKKFDKKLYKNRVFYAITHYIPHLYDLQCSLLRYISSFNEIYLNKPRCYMFDENLFFEIFAEQSTLFTNIIDDSATS